MSLRLTIILLLFLKLIYNGAVYRLFRTLSGKQFKLERPWMEKLKFKQLNGVFVWNSLISWSSKNTWFCVCENKSYSLSTITTKHANIFY